MDSKINKQIAKSSYKKEKERKETIGTYNYDPTTSTKNISVYVDTKNKNVKTSYRGTNINNPKDLLADFHILTGTESKSNRFKNTLKQTDIIIDKYKNYNISNYSHSLGGSQGIYVAKKRNIDKTIAYNAGYSPLSIGRDIKQAIMPTKKQERGIKTTTLKNVYGDPVSITSNLLSNSKIKNKLPTKFNIHSLSNF